MGHRAIIDFLETVTDEEIEIISIVNDVDIQYEKINFERYKNINSTTFNLEFDLTAASNFIDFCVYRKKDEVKVFLWK